jgi:hypothetical protein
MALKQNTENVEHILMSSIVVGYVYCSIMRIIPFSISETVDNVCIVLSAIICAYCFARIVQNKKIMLPILDKLNIRETGNLYLWDDLVDNDYPMRVIVTYEDAIYDGMLHIFESYSNVPHIVLGAYVIKDAHGRQIIYDRSEDSTSLIVLDISKAKDVEIVYHKDSVECVDIKNLCNYRGEYVKEIDK